MFKRDIVYSPLTTPTPTLLLLVLMGNTWNHSSVLVLYASIVDRPENTNQASSAALCPKEGWVRPTCAAVEASHSIQHSIQHGSAQRGAAVLHAAHTRPAVHHRVVTVDCAHAQRTVESTDGVHASTHVHHTFRAPAQETGPI